jgi:hypothetical protein
MTVGITPSEADAVLKQLYPADQVKFLGYEGHPLLAMLPKMEDFKGSAIKIPVHWGGHTGVSASFAKAQANQAKGLYDAFLITRVNHYGLTSIQMEAYEAAMSEGSGSFVNLLTEETDGMFRNLGAQLARACYRNAGGAKGQVGSVSTTTLTLKNPADIVNFEKGEKITSSNTDGTSGSDDGQALTITAIDRDAGTLTTSVTWTAGGNFSDNDYLFQEGDFGLGIAGVASWLPTSAPSSTSFFGVNRSTDVVRLGGVRYDGSSNSIEEALQIAEAKLVLNGGKPSHVFMHTDDWNALRIALGSRVVYDRVQSAVAPISFRSIVLQGVNDVQIIPDRDCPKGLAYMMTLQDWKLYSLGAAPKFLSHPGLGDSLIVYNDDAVEYRACYRAQLGCRAPGHSCVITLPSA